MDMELRSVSGTPGTTDKSATATAISVHKLSLWTAAFFIVGEVAGSGVLALPKALAGIGWAGIAVLLVCYFSSAYSGLYLARCWVILEDRWPEYRGPNRKPYPAIGVRAFGTWMKFLVSACLHVTCFGTAAVYLLLCAQLIGSMLTSTGVLGCYWVIILGAILCPLTWFGTPAEFWPVAVGAVGTSVVACVLMIIAMGLQASQTTPVYEYSGFKDFFLSLGTMLFAFGGASNFPTFQNDMEDRTLFPKTVMIAFMGVIALYLPVATVGYWVFGSDVEADLVISLNQGVIRIIIEVLLAGHFFFAFLIYFNPMVQDLEEVLSIPTTFGWKRCMTRTLVVIGVIFTGETIPKFGKILNLLGSSTITLSTFVFPSLFYIRLCDQKEDKRFIPVYTRVFLIAIMLLGVVGGSISTYSAFVDIVSPDSFTKPCYLDKYSADVN